MGYVLIAFAPEIVRVAIILVVGRRQEKAYVILVAQLALEVAQVVAALTAEAAQPEVVAAVVVVVEPVLQIVLGVQGARAVPVARVVKEIVMDAKVAQADA